MSANPLGPRVLMIAAPSSGAGKSMVALALLRALRRAGMRVAGAKSGPDYLDPSFHAAASGGPSFNLDAWAMDGPSLRARAVEGAAGAELLLVEGAMGLLDGAPDRARPEGRGSAADLAEALGAPVLLVLDVARQGQTAAAVALGLRAARPSLRIAGVLLNRVGSDRHRRMVERAVQAAGFPVWGVLPSDPALATPSRHLGLKPAGERPDLEAFLDQAAALASRHVDLGAVQNAAQPIREGAGGEGAGAGLRRLPPLGQRIAVARDAAFSFIYPHLLADWRAQGAEISFFSPLADQAPEDGADSVFLPGGYPELHAPTLAAAERYRNGLASTAARGALIYGECGGYMALGQGLTDAEDRHWPMAGLLPHATSFAERERRLGYRRLRLLGDAPLFVGAAEPEFFGHEFHYATESGGADAAGLYKAWDAEGSALGVIGRSVGRVCGSFAHLIAPKAPG